MIGSDETNIEGEIVYKAPGGQREPTIEIVEIEENVRGRNGGGEEGERRGWGGGREGRRRGRKRRPGRQREMGEEEGQGKKEEDEKEEEERREKDFRYDKNLFHSPASNRHPPSFLLLLFPLVFHS